jgi:outer membrane protein assembly factor BamE (lipoprotein component of BamABCDE complex)
MTSYRTTILLCLVLALAGCKKESKPEPKAASKGPLDTSTKLTPAQVKEKLAECETDQRSYDQYASTLKVPYKSSVNDAQWTSEYKQLQFGMERDKVQAIMGKPDYVKSAAGMKRESFAGCLWHYSVHQQNKELADKKANSWISLLFDSKGQLRAKEAVNVPGIPNGPIEVAR